MDLLGKQQTCFENIKKLCTNYKKDSISRKNTDYLENRLSNLEHQWVEFQDRHETILESIHDKTQASYFINNVYEKTKQLHETIKRI